MSKKKKLEEEELGETLRKYLNMDSSKRDWISQGHLAGGWVIMAYDLICAAEILAERVRKARTEPVYILDIGDETGLPSFRPVYLLYGLGIENLLKGLFVMKGTPAVVEERLRDEFATHDLVRLCHRTDISLSHAEEKLLRKLQWAVTAGKYPLGKKPSSYLPEASHSEFEQISLTVKRLKDEYAKAARDERGWRKLFRKMDESLSSIEQRSDKT